MKRITAVELTNFGRHRALAVDLSAPVTFLTGYNDSGKSTVIRAVCYALTGWAAPLDQRGSGAERLTSRGREDKGSVALTLEDGSQVVREVGQGPASKIGQALAVSVGVPATIAQVCLAWDRLAGLPPDELAAILLPLIGAEITPERVKASLLANGCTQDDFGALAPLKLRTVADLKAAHAYVYQERRTAGQAASAGELPSLDAYPEAIRALPATEVRDRLKGARTLLSSLQEQLSSASRASASSGASEAVRQARMADLEESLASLKEQKKALKPVGAAEMQRLKGAAMKAAEAFDLAGDAFRAATEAHGAAQAEADAAQKALDAGSTRVDADRCPTCGHEITEKKGAEVLNALKRRVKDSAKALAAALSDYSDADREQTDAHNAMTVAQRAADAAYADAEKAARIAAEIKRVTDELALVQPPPKATGPAVDIEAVRQRIERGMVIVAQLEAYLPARELYDRTVIDRAAADSSRASLDRLCDALSPKGPVYADLFGSKLNAFCGTLNGVLHPLGYSAGFDSEAMRFVVKCPGEAGLFAFDELSSSVRIRLALALQIGLAASSGFGTVALDDVDRLDQPSRLMLVKAVNDALAAGKVRQFILAGTLSGAATDFKAPEIPGWRFEVVTRNGNGTA